MVDSTTISVFSTPNYIVIPKGSSVVLAKPTMTKHCHCPTERGKTRWGWSKHGNYSQHFYHTNVTGPKTKEEMGLLTELSTDLLTRHCHAVFSGTWENGRSDHCPAPS